MLRLDASLPAWRSGMPQPIMTRSTPSGKASSRSRELDKFGPEGLERFESVRKITAKCFILRIGDPEAPAAFREAAGTRSADGRGERAATGQVADGVQVAVAKKIGRKAGKQFLGKHLVAVCSLQPPTNCRHRLQGPKHRNGKGQAN